MDQIVDIVVMDEADYSIITVFSLETITFE